MKVPFFVTEAEVITFYVGQYYEAVSAKPEVRFNSDEHIALIEQLNVLYRKALTYAPPGSDVVKDFETYQDSFLDNIDYLTGVFSKIKNREDLSEMKKAFRDRNKKGKNINHEPDKV